MAKVKCLYCGKLLERDSDDCVKVNSRRYAHKECADIYQTSLVQEDADKKALKEYICKMFGITEVSQKIEKQIEKYHTEYKYTYSGMLKALIYHYEIQHNDIAAANGGVGILPYVYNQALEYYYEIWKNQQANNGFDPADHVQKTVIIKIAPPQRRGKRKKIFNIEESVNE